MDFRRAIGLLSLLLLVGATAVALYLHFGGGGQSSGNALSATKLPATGSTGPVATIQSPGSQAQNSASAEIEAKIEAELRKLGLYEHLTAAQLEQARAMMRGTKPSRKLEPLVSRAVILAYLAEKNTSGAYIAAAGAERDPAWLDKGLARFPNNAELLRAKALMDFAYLKDPELLAAWQRAEPSSGWPSLLEADIALRLKQPQKAYELIQLALTKDLEFASTAGVEEFIATTGSHPNTLHFNQDLGRDGSNITKRMANELMDAAKATRAESAETGWEYYAAAALALNDLSADSSYSEAAEMAARYAMKSLELLGPENSLPFLDGQAYDQMQQQYEQIIVAARANRVEALAYLETLTGEAKTNFEALHNKFGAARALALALGTGN